MPRARSPNRDKAFELWIASEGQRELKDIASELGVSPGQVRNWKNQDDWDGRTHKVTSRKGKRDVTKRNRGGQRGNKNAVGNSGGPPLGNKNSLKHGAYERIMAGLLSEDEAQVFADEETGTDVEAELRSTLAALNAKEIRLMKHINSITASAKGGQIVRGVDKTVTETRKGSFTEDERGHLIPVGASDAAPATVQSATATHTTSMYDALDKLEAELDRVQARKVKILSKLEDIKVQRQRLELERKRLDGENEQSKLAKAWIAALTGEEMDDSDDAEETD
jgi:uncharacterized protein YjcR